MSAHKSLYDYLPVYHIAEELNLKEIPPALELEGEYNNEGTVFETINVYTPQANLCDAAEYSSTCELVSTPSDYENPHSPQ